MAGIYSAVVARTRQALGRVLSPHLFRDCAVTSLAVETPQLIGIATPLLGHRNISTTERYYNQVLGIEASRLVQATLLALRHKDGDKVSDDPVDLQK